jgi:hypothetical protein
MLLTVRGAYHSDMVAMVFRKTKGGEDTQKILTQLSKFYKILSGRNVDPFDYTKAAELELKWWMVDRYPKRYRVTRAIALEEGMSTIYNVPASKLAAYGQKRAEAMELLGDYHHDTSAEVDWEKLKQVLRGSY